MSATNSRRYAAAAVRALGVPMACWMAVNFPSRMRAPGRRVHVRGQPGQQPGEDIELFLHEQVVGRREALGAHQLRRA